MTLQRKPLQRKSTLTSPRIGAGRTLKFKKGKSLSTTKKKRIKPSSASKLLKEADAVFSRYVRLSHAKNEIATCYTCGHQNHWKKLQNGHYISRYYKKYRFDERNCRVQCSMCNMWKSGDIPTFRMKLVSEIGAAEVEAMESDYKQLFPLTREFLEEIINKYKPVVDNLLEHQNPV